MTKREFLNQLEARLAQLPQAERLKSLGYYAEIIDDRVEEGMAEEEAVEALGDIGELARQILLDAPLPTLIKSTMPKKRWATWEVVLLVLGFPLWFPLLISFFAVVFSIYVSVWAVIISLFAAVASILVTGLALVAASFVAMFTLGPWWVILLGAGLTLLGLGILAILGMIWFSKVLVSGTIAMGKGIKSLFLRKETKHEKSN